jgi:F-type H+-transporting ATPase subunit alpha
MNDAQQALQKAASKIPADVAGRFTTAAKLSDGDRKTVLAIATSALAPFELKPAPPKPALPS